MRQAVAQLDYAPRQGWHAGRRLRRIALGMTLAAAVLLAVKFLPPAWRHGQLLYWQRKCLDQTLPTDRVVFSRFVSAPVSRAQSWDNFYSLFSPPGRKAATTVFTHRMTRKDGQERLVAIDMLTSRGTTRNSFTGAIFDVHVIEPGSAWTPPRLLSNNGIGLFNWPDGDRRQAILFSGQIDPGDRSHLTIAYQEGESTGIIDGYLQNDDTLLLQPRTQEPR